MLVQNVKASHIAGGDLSYTCLGNNQYQINLNLFVDCLGFDPGAQQTIDFTSTCGGTATMSVDVTNPGGTEISQLCPSQINNSTCNGGNLPGMWVFHFTGIVTLSPQCDTWTMSWTTCCRNAAILNITGADNFGSYIQATLNSITDSCNNSPSFTSQPIPYVCANQQVVYNYGIVETDGDSLYYSLIDAMDAGGVILTYAPGYSAAAPIPGITIDQTTGLLTFTPTTLGNFVVVILVQEYDNSGNLIGTVMRDIQFVVQSCTNIVPDPTAGVISGLTGTAVQTGPFALELCEGSTFNFNAVYTDSNPGDSLTLISNISTVLPGSTFIVTGANPLTATISWAAPAGSANTNTAFSVTVNDGACPIPGQQTFVYDINVLTRTLAGPDIIICGAQTATLNGTGGNVFTWNAISGPAIAVGTNFSCNPCANPIASPAITTTYEVVSDLSGTCLNKDTITVTVVPDFTESITQSGTITCLMQDPIQLHVIVSPIAPGYTYLWSLTALLDNYTIPNPTTSSTTPGTHTYVVTVTSPDGCVKKDTTSVTITPSYAPNPIAYGSDTLACPGDTIQLGVTFGTSIPSVCGINSVGCSAPLNATIGTGTATNTATDWPAPYGNWYTSAKHQFLFKASELIAAGITGGKIDQLDFNVTLINGITLYHEYTINMGCTNATALSTWISGLYNVYTPKNYSVVTGWNSHPFDNAFEWDGISNVIVEICFTEGPSYPNYTQNCLSPYTATSFVSCLYSFSDITAQCPDLTNFINTASNRPNTKFYFCGGAPDSSRYTYNWFPPAGIVNTHGQTTEAILPGQTQYYVIVTDTVSGCLDTAYFYVNATTPTPLVVEAGNNVTICPGTPTTLTASGATNYSWSPTTALSNNNTASTIASPSTTITYTVTGTADCAVAPAKDSVTVNVLNGPTLMVSAGADQEVCGPDPFYLSATSSGGDGGNSYTWTILSGTSTDSIHNPNSSTANVIPTAEYTNTYQVTVVDSCGNTATDMVIVTTFLACKLNIPNVFTPNGDGVNDYFLISGVGLKSYSLTIFDRWGKKVFESDNVLKSWDGKNENDGTYYYLIKAESVGGKQFDEKGFVQRIGK